MPSVITAGLNFNFKRKYDDYLPADSWVGYLYIFNNGIQYTVTATDNSDGHHLFSKVASETSAYIAGDYSFNILVVNGINKWPVESGLITIEPNIILATGGIDVRSHAKKMIDNLDKVFESLSKTTTTEVTVDGVTYKRSSLNELIKTYNYFKNIYSQELRKDQMAQGLADPFKKYVRFVPR